MGMYSDKSYFLTKDEFNYILAPLKKHLLESQGRYYFIGSPEEMNDMVARLGGLYDNYEPVKSMLLYKCFIQCSIEPWRKEHLKIKRD